MTIPTPRKIAICFFGIPRSLEYTIDSILENVIAPARKRGEVKVFAHFFNQATVENPRTGERGEMGVEAWRLLEPDVFLQDSQDLADVADLKSVFRRHPDPVGDEYRTLGNLSQQLISISRVANAAADWDPDMTVFVRPDLVYHDQFGPVLDRALAGPNPGIYLPDWQHYLGVNDRFAICVGDAACSAWGQRARSVQTHVDAGTPLNAEAILASELYDKKIPLVFIGLRGSRVRLGGEFVEENFANYKILRNKIRRDRTLRMIRSCMMKAGLPVEKVSLRKLKRRLVP